MHQGSYTLMGGHYKNQTNVAERMSLIFCYSIILSQLLCISGNFATNIVSKSEKSIPADCNSPGLCWTVSLLKNTQQMRKVVFPLCLLSFTQMAVYLMRIFKIFSKLFDQVVNHCLIRSIPASKAFIGFSSLAYDHRKGPDPKSLKWQVGKYYENTVTSRKRL